ncbi:isochorismatase family protein [Kribbella sp. NPDC020789]
MTSLKLDPRRTALVLIDLMPRIIALETAPLKGSEVLERCVAAAKATRAAGGLVVNVRVERPGVDHQPEGSGFAEAPEPGDLEIVKNCLGAFGRSALDAELRQRDINTLVLAGLVTNFGVESTARAADDLGYETVYLTDAMAGLEQSAHDFAVSYVFSRLGTLCSASEYVAALS